MQEPLFANVSNERQRLPFPAAEVFTSLSRNTSRKKTILHFANVFPNTGYVGFPVLNSVYGIVEKIPHLSWGKSFAKVRTIKLTNIRYSLVL